MIADILSAVWKSALGWLVGKVFSLFGATPAPKVSNDERLGQEETKAAQVTKELDDAQKSVDAGRAAAADDTNGGLRNPHPGDKPWNPDGIG